jgi:hypothetical protein
LSLADLRFPVRDLLLQRRVLLRQRGHGRFQIGAMNQLSIYGERHPTTYGNQGSGQKAPDT